MFAVICVLANLSTDICLTVEWVTMCPFPEMNKKIARYLHVIDKRRIVIGHFKFMIIRIFQATLRL